MARGRHAGTLPPHSKRKEPYGLGEGEKRLLYFDMSETYNEEHHIFFAIIVFHFAVDSCGPSSKFHLLEKQGMCSLAFHPIRSEKSKWTR